MNKIAEYAYLIELLAIGLLSLAIFGVAISLLMRQGKSREKYQELRQLRDQAEESSLRIDDKLESLGTLEQELQENMNASKIQLEAIQDEQNVTFERADEIEKRAETVAQLEAEMKTAIETITERLNHIQTYWDKQLNDTVNTINQINAKLDDGLQRTIEQEKLANNLLTELTDKYGSITTISDEDSTVQQQIKSNLMASMDESEKLLEQLKNYQNKAEKSFNHFSDELSGFESQAVEQFDAVFNAADVARQEMNANLDESRQFIQQIKSNETTTNTKPASEPPALVVEGLDNSNDQSTTKSDDFTIAGIVVDDDLPAPFEELVEESVDKQKKEKEDKKRTERDDRPILNMSSAEDLTDPSLLDKYGGYSDVQDKKLVSLFSKIRKNG